MRTASADQGLRLAAHQIKITAELVADPVRGGDMSAGHGLAMFFAAALSLDDPDVTAQVELMQAQLAGDETAWRSALRRYGLTRSEGESLLLVPPDGVGDDVDINEVTVAPSQPTGSSV